MARFKLEFPGQGDKITVFSIPQTNHYQTIKTWSVDQTDKTAVIEEKRFGNRILIISPNQELSYLNLRADLHSINKKINPQFLISDYQHNDSIISQYLTPSRFINGNDNTIGETVRKTMNKELRLDYIIRALYDHTLSYLSYGNPIDGLYSYKEAYTAQITDCGGFSTYLASLLQAVNIPCRLVVGFVLKPRCFGNLLFKFDIGILNFDLINIHAWLEVLLPDNSWFPLDPAVEWRRNHKLSNRRGGYGNIPADRLVVSFGEDFKIEISNHSYNIDLLQKPILIQSI